MWRNCQPHLFEVKVTCLNMLRTYWWMSYNDGGGPRSENEQGRVSFLSVKPSPRRSFISFSSPSFHPLSSIPHAALVGVGGGRRRQREKTQNLETYHKDEVWPKVCSMGHALFIRCHWVITKGKKISGAKHGKIGWATQNWTRFFTSLTSQSL